MVVVEVVEVAEVEEVAEEEEDLTIWDPPLALPVCRTRDSFKFRCECAMIT